MGRNRIEEADIRAVADELNVTPAQVKSVVWSFFAPLISHVRSLPFDNPGRIYTKERFESYVSVFSIPRIGRLGPVYSRYRKWRKNEAKYLARGKRSDYRTRMTQDDIENIAGDILSGITPTFPKRMKYELFRQVWIFGKDGRRLARQVIPKQ